MINKTINKATALHSAQPFLTPAYQLVGSPFSMIKLPSGCSVIVFGVPSG
jgi:hypothetical protein